MLRLGKGLVIAAGLAIFTASAADARTYQFRVTCAEGSYVALWNPDPADPSQDRDYFRIATGDENLDCSIYDYNAKTDRNLPRRWCSYPGGIIRGFPPLLILSGLSHCQ